MAAPKTFRLVIPKFSEISFKTAQYSQKVAWNGLSWRLQVHKEEVDETLHLDLMLYYARNEYESSSLVTIDFTWTCKLLPCIPMFNVLCRRRRHHMDEDDGEVYGEDDWIFASNVTFQFTMNSEVGYIAEDDIKVDLTLEPSTISRKWTHEELDYEEVWEDVMSKSGSSDGGNYDNATDNDGAGTGDNEKERDDAGSDDEKDEVEMETEKNCEDKKDGDSDGAGTDDSGDESDDEKYDEKFESADNGLDEKSRDSDGAGTDDNGDVRDDVDEKDDEKIEIPKNSRDEKGRDAAVSTGIRSKQKSDGESSDDPLDILEKEIGATEEESVLLTKEHVHNYSNNDVPQELTTTHETLLKEHTRLVQELTSLRNSLHRLKMNRDTALIEAGYLAQSLICVPMCYVCGSKPVNKMLLPCRHMSVCAPCSLIISFCPRCKYPIMNAVTPSSCILSEHLHSTT